MRIEQPVEALGLDPQALLQRPAEAAQRGLLVGADRGLRQLGDRGGQLTCPAERTAAGHDLVDEADRERLACVDHPPGDDQVHRAPPADDARQPLRAAVGEADVPAPAGDAERRVLVGDGQVRPADPLEPARVGHAVDRRDRGLVEVGPARGPEHSGPLAAYMRRALVRGQRDDRRPVLQRLQVAAGRERLVAATGQYAHERAVVVAKARPGVDQLLVHRRPDRGHPLGPVEGDRDDGTVLLVAHELVFG